MDYAAKQASAMIVTVMVVVVIVLPLVGIRLVVVGA